ncbi:melatonin receptor type 1B-B-like [Patiria miniata]|uniref:G-protein coupled receptors family 1 profile domain-containing protein n=1 Tax=Patiria miniata TaxID=46514 RepID=A0A913YXK0_PATMI|nr:melatonin receptor type 1B-B-like [Patiria miniata]
MGGTTVNSTIYTTVWTDTEMTVQPFQVYTHYYQRQIIAALCITATCLGIVGNGLVIIAVVVSKKLRTITNVFVVNLSISDLLACSFLPWQAVAVLSEAGWPLHGADWLCVISAAFMFISNGCSTTNLALIALNRWIGITKSVSTTRRIYTRCSIAGMVLFSWIMPICLTVIPTTIGFGQLGYEPKYSTCSWLKDVPMSYIMNILIPIFYFPIQFLVILLCYVSIYRYVIKSSRRMTRHDINSISGATGCVDRAMQKMIWKRQIAVTKNLLHIVLAFVIFVTPSFIAMIPLGYDWSIRMTPYAAAIVFFSSCINPIIYGTSHPDFKETFSRMIFCKKWRNTTQTANVSQPMTQMMT